MTPSDPSAVLRPGSHQEDTKDLKTFKFIDKNGDVFASFNDLNLDFNHQFFIDVKDFKDEYNKDFASIKLQELEDVFLSKNSTYRKNNYDDIKKGRDIIQPRVKEIIKEAFGLDKIKLERCYEGCEGEETLFEILYEVPKDIYHMIHILSKLK